MDIYDRFNYLYIYDHHLACLTMYDLSKAFDSVVHEVLLVKIIFMGTEGWQMTC